jgi:hypothetical protein
MNSGFNKLEVDDLTHVHKDVDSSRIWKNSLNHSNVIVKYWVSCVLVYYNKCKMQFANNGFNI